MEDEAIVVLSGMVKRLLDTPGAVGQRNRNQPWGGSLVHAVSGRGRVDSDAVTSPAIDQRRVGWCIAEILTLRAA